MNCKHCNRHIDDMCSDCENYKNLKQNATGIRNDIIREMEAYPTGRAYQLINLHSKSLETLLEILEDV